MSVCWLPICLWNFQVLCVSEECLIENDIRSYSYLTNGYVPIVMGEDDVELYRQVLEAMDVLGFTKDEQIGQLHSLISSNPYYWDDVCTFRLCVHYHIYKIYVMYILVVLCIRLWKKW